MADPFDALTDEAIKGSPPPGDDPFNALTDDAIKASPPTLFDKFMKPQVAASAALKGAAESIVGYPMDQWTSEAKSEVGKFIDEAGGGMGLGDRVFDQLGKGLNLPIKALGGTFNALSRGMAAPIAYGIDGYTGLFGVGSMYDKAQLQDMQNQLNQNRALGERDAQDPNARLPITPSRFPLTLANLAQKPTEAGLENLTKYLSEGGHTDAASVVEGLTPLVSNTAGLAAEVYGLPVPKLGALTELGEAAQKEGTLVDGLPQAMQAGQRKGLTVNLFGGFGGGVEIPLATQKVTAQFVAKAQSAAMSLEASRVGQMARMYTTMSSLPWIGKEAQQRGWVENLIEANKNKFVEVMGNKAEQIGLDLTDQAQRKDFYSFIENPTTYTPKYAQNIPMYNQMFTHMDQLLAEKVAEARAAGVDIGEFIPQNGENMSERFVPRVTNSDSARLYQINKYIKDGTEAQKAAEEMGLIEGKTSGSSTSFLEKRSLFNRDKMNELMEAKTGIKDFFVDDPIKAYAQKIADVSSAVEDKKFIESVLSKSGKSVPEWINIRNQAALRVNEAQAAGLIPSVEDLKLAKVDVRNLKTLDNDVVRVLSSKSKSLTGEGGLQGLMLPASDADLVNSVIKTPERSMLNAYVGSYMNIWKRAVLFNPGFIGRHGFSSYTRAVQSGLSTADIAAGQGAYIFGKGDLGKYVDEYKSLAGSEGIASEAAAQNGAKIIAPADAVDMENAHGRLLDTFQEMGQRGTIKKWFNAAADKLDPVLNFARSTVAGVENSFKFSYYGKLRSQGIAPMDAMRMVEDNFVSYNNIRNSVVRLQPYMPFANFMIKNAETTVNLLKANPRGALVFGPNGALQRQVENWAGWDPNQVDDFKQLHGQYYTDQILGPILPGKDQMLAQKDYIKQFMNTWLDSDGQQAGFQTWARLPSNYHAMMEMDPRRATEMSGPLVKMGLALALGIDGATGQKILGADDPSIAAMQRIQEAGKQFVGGIWPQKLVNSAREQLFQSWPKAEEAMANFGFNKDFIDTIVGDRTDEDFRKKTKAALISAKSLWMGNATKVDVDIFFRQQAIMKNTESDLQAMAQKIGEKGTDRDLDQHINRMLRVLNKTADEMINFIDIKNDYDKRVEAIGGTPEAEVELKDMNTEEPEPTKDEAPVPDQEEINSSDNDQAFMRMNSDRMPAGEQSGMHLDVNPSGLVNAVVGGKLDPALSAIWNAETANEPSTAQKLQDFKNQSDPSYLKYLEDQDQAYRMMKKKFEKNPTIDWKIGPARNLASEGPK